MNPQTRLAKNSRFRNVLNSKKQLEFLYAVFLRRFLILLFTLFFLCHFLMWLVVYNNIQQMMAHRYYPPPNITIDSELRQRSHTSCLKTTATMPSPSQTLSREQGIFATMPHKKKTQKSTNQNDFKARNIVIISPFGKWSVFSLR